ncbi:choice-of-anchor H family protein [Shewanella maritima]|uniref:choice-of-anchor H family protein n=1 Tax=Shewanella maritima TaxID=2520507 RepID=UPI003736157C
MQNHKAQQEKQRTKNMTMQPGLTYLRQKLTSTLASSVAVILWLGCHSAFAQNVDDTELDNLIVMTSQLSSSIQGAVSVGGQVRKPTSSDKHPLQQAKGVSNSALSDEFSESDSDVPNSYLLQRLRGQFAKEPSSQATRLNRDEVIKAKMQQSIERSPSSSHVQLSSAQASITPVSSAQVAIAQVDSTQVDSALVSQPTNAALYYDFSIYDAYSRLYDDFNYNGFYQTFTVTFDADILGPTGYEIANVYAEMYLSKNGGPWERYYTTDIFTIEGDRSDDDYEVLTTLASGYPTDHYDVLIDLYEVGYSDIVATISSEDVDSLYALPLESSDWDIDAAEVIIVEEYSSGSLGVVATVGLFMIAIYRRKKHLS